MDIDIDKVAQPFLENIHLTLKNHIKNLTLKDYIKKPTRIFIQDYLEFISQYASYKDKKYIAQIVNILSKPELQLKTVDKHQLIESKPKLMRIIKKYKWINYQPLIVYSYLTIKENNSFKALMKKKEMKLSKMRSKSSCLSCLLINKRIELLKLQHKLDLIQKGNELDQQIIIH
jgi:hypothetical protein